MPQGLRTLREEMKRISESRWSRVRRTEADLNIKEVGATEVVEVSTEEATTGGDVFISYCFQL